MIYYDFILCAVAGEGIKADNSKVKLRKGVASHAGELTQIETEAGDVIASMEDLQKHGIVRLQLEMVYDMTIDDLQWNVDHALSQ